MTQGQPLTEMITIILRLPLVTSLCLATGTSQYLNLHSCQCPPLPSLSTLNSTFRVSYVVNDTETMGTTRM